MVHHGIGTMVFHGIPWYIYKGENTMVHSLPWYFFVWVTLISHTTVIVKQDTLDRENTWEMFRAKLHQMNDLHQTSHH